MLYYIITVTSVIIIPFTFLKYQKEKYKKQTLEITEYHDLWSDLYELD